MRLIVASVFAGALALAGCDKGPETKPAEPAAPAVTAPVAPPAPTIGTTEADLLAGKPINPDATSKAWDFSIGSNFDISMDVTLQAEQPKYATLFAGTNGEGAGFSFEMSAPLQFALYAWTDKGNVVSQPIALTAGAKHKVHLKSDATVGMTLEIDGASVFTAKSVPKPSIAPFRTGTAIFAGREPKWTIAELRVSGDIAKK